MFHCKGLDNSQKIRCWNNFSSTRCFLNTNLKYENGVFVFFNAFYIVYGIVLVLNA